MRLFLSPPETCGYLPDRRASSLFVDPQLPLDMRRYSALVRLGFRRSGRYVYRPHCAGCAACRPARVPVARFHPDRSQRRNLRNNAGLEIVRRDDAFRDSHYRLYQAYQQRRHPGGSMADADRDAFHGFLTAPWTDTEFCEFRADGELACVAVYDRLDDGLSAVYTFYSAAAEQRALGKFAVMWLIGEARRRGLEYVYLGYWIEACPKMAYKADFAPLQVHDGARWRDLQQRIHNRLPE